MSKVIIHADDYAISGNVSKSVVAQIEAGAIHSISVMPNMEATTEGIRLLAPYANQVLTSIHLNLVEGKCVADAKQIPLIADSKGYLKLSWLMIMFKSFSREFRKQAQIEFRAQIEQTDRLLKEAGFTGKIRLDSHQHIHMIPGIFQIVCILAKEYDAEYIRLTREPILPYLREVGLWKTYNPVDVAKNILLNLFSLRDKHMLKRLNLKYNYFFGLLITGKMDYERVAKLMPHMPSGKNLEIVLHAGRMLKSEITKEYNKKDFIKEHISPRRLLELETVERLHEKKCR